MQELVEPQSLLNDSTAFTQDYAGEFDADAFRAKIKAAKAAAGSSIDARRAALIRTLNEAKATTYAQAEELLRYNQEGLKCAATLSQYHDALVFEIYRLACEKFCVGETKGAVIDVAVVATGGYGRGLMAPGSDVDLLFLVPERQSKDTNTFVEFILYILWDLGLKVGHATRSINQCIQQAKADHTIRTSMLDARLLAGNQDIFDAFTARFQSHVIKGTRRDYIAAKLEERDARHRHTGRSRYLVEPNVKDGKGGLRDLHTLHWLVKDSYFDASDADWIERGVFRKDELESFRICEDFLWAVRCNLHFVAGKPEERLSFDMQPVLAERMCYCGDDRLKAVERFMKHYFGVAKAVGDLTRIVCAVLELDQLSEVPRLHRFLNSIPWPSKSPHISAEGFVIENGRLNISSPEAFSEDPVNLIRLFALSEENDIMLHPEALRQARASLPLINDEVREDPEANRLFLEMLTSPTNAEDSLRRMNEAGVLGQFIPDFGLIVSMMQFNMYHHYTVDEHLIQAVGILCDIVNGQDASNHPLSTEIMPSIKNRRILFVAILLHDVAKGRDEDHSIAGAKVARALCPRFGLTPVETETVAWLIEQHLVMSHFAQTRDVHDARTAWDLAEIAQTTERLKLLLVLTVADIRAVGPGVWTGWKGQLLRDLYHETIPLLMGGQPRQEMPMSTAEAQALLRKSLDTWTDNEYVEYVNRLYPSYWLKTELRHQISHARLMKYAAETKTPLVADIDTDEFTEMTDITVFTASHARLLERIAGACAVAGANIVGAQIGTTRDGMAIDTITIQRDFPEREDEERRARRIIDTIEKLVRGEVRLANLLAARQKTTRRIAAFTVEPEIKIDNSLSKDQTVIELTGLDRIGLLYDLTRALVDLKLLVESAHITTFGEKAVDVFYVTDMMGAKVRDEKRHDKIRERLYPELRGEHAD